MPRRLALAATAAAAAAAAAAIGAAACQPPRASAPPPPRPAGAPVEFALVKLVGGWRWLHRTTEAGTTRVEDEAWRFQQAPDAPTRLVGRYVRTVEVRSDDRTPFRCNQRPWYHLRAVFDVEVEPTPQGFAIRELAHRTEPSPCEGGARKLGAYEAALAGGRLVLRFPGGEQTLWQVDADRAPLPEEPWPAAPGIEGSWRWDASSYDDAGNIRDESEWWQLTRRTETRLDATYRRRVTVRTPDGKRLPCAGAPSWTFDDAYVLDAQRDGDRWRFHELGAEPGAHPCLRATPRRHLDEATAEPLGDHLVLTWRGKRRQVLYRPAPPPGEPAPGEPERYADPPPAGSYTLPR